MRPAAFLFLTRGILALCLIGTLGACSKAKSDSAQPGQLVQCTCPYLTDYDQVATHTLQVCIGPGVDAVQAAYACASKMTHGPAEPCKCQAPQGPCDGKEPCKSLEYK